MSPSCAGDDVHILYCFSLLYIASEVRKMDFGQRIACASSVRINTCILRSIQNYRLRIIRYGNGTKLK